MMQKYTLTQKQTVLAEHGYWYTNNTMGRHHSGRDGPDGAGEEDHGHGCQGR